MNKCKNTEKYKTNHKLEAVAEGYSPMMRQGRNSNIPALSHLPKDYKIMRHQTQRQHSTGCDDAIIYRYFAAAGGTD